MLELRNDAGHGQAWKMYGLCSAADDMTIYYFKDKRRTIRIEAETEEEALKKYIKRSKP